MINFSITTQIKKEIQEFEEGKVTLASLAKEQSVRHLSKQSKGYVYNQLETINLIDLYYNSKFESGPRDKLGQRKIFMNVGKFRTDVAAKQIDLDVKDFRFVPDEYSSPWTAIFLQKDFKEWAKDTYFGELLNTCVDSFPKYGSLVLKRVGKKIQFTPLQNLINDQTAESLQTARYVIEKHPEMTAWEIKEMKLWNTDGLDLRYDGKWDVYERYGRVPLAWLKGKRKEEVMEGDENIFVDAMVIASIDEKTKGKEHVFYCTEVTKRPYEEAHWQKQYGRWLGIGVVEDLFENQEAKNIIVNLIRRSLHWSSKRLFQSATADAAAKNLLKEVQDGTVMEVGVQGAITQVDLTNRSSSEYQQFLNEWERNSDQKAFTYEVATGEALPSGTPFRLGVVLQNSVNSYFALKREKLGLFLKRAINEFLVPEFLKDMAKKERVVEFFSDENGFEVLKNAAMQLAKGEAIRTSLLQRGEEVDVQTIEQAISPFQAITRLQFALPANYYENVKFKFDLIVTGEQRDITAEIETLSTLYQLLAGVGDPRAENILDKISALSGQSLASFNNVRPRVMAQPNEQAQPAVQNTGQPA